MYEYQHANALRRIVRRVSATRVVSRIYVPLLHRLDRFTLRATGGRTTFSGSLSGLPVVWLTTTGARTGRRRTLPVLGIPDGDDIIVIASNYGQRHHPAWYHNLRADPRVEVRVGGVVRRFEARELTGDERERCFHRGVEILPGWLEYRRRAGSRQIPVIRLSPRS